MKPAPFQMHLAHSQDEVLSLLDLHGEEARILAGGQTLVPVLAMRVANPKHLIDINQIEEFKHFTVTNGALQVGAGVRQSQLEEWPDLSKVQPLLKLMFPWIAHTPIRNRGTICGSIAHADPSAELVLALVTLGGSIHLASRRSKRTVKAKDFFLGALQTDRRSDELITSVQFSMRAEEAGYGFSEFGYRHGDFAVVAVVAIKESGYWTIGFGGIDDTIKVHRFTAESLDEVYQAIDQLASTIQVREDPTATSGLRRHLMRTLGRNACQQAVEFRKDQVV
jgi:2-furoyl-CoA dehydrogenase FAD binding subunit